MKRGKQTSNGYWIYDVVYISGENAILTARCLLFRCVFHVVDVNCQDVDQMMFGLTE